MTIGELEDRLALLEIPSKEKNTEGKGGLAFVAAMLAALYAGYNPYLCIPSALLVTLFYMYIRYKIKIHKKEGENVRKRNLPSETTEVSRS